MIPKQDRQGVRKATDIEQKYDLNLDYAGIEKMAANAQRAAEQANSKSENATSMANEAKMAANEAKQYTDDQMKLLWENENPDIAFSAQTVPIDLIAYELVAIKFRVKEAICKTAVGSVGDTVLLDAVCPTSNNTLMVAYRMATTSDSGITFENGIYQTHGSVPTNDNSYIVPCQIYGLKERSNQDEREDEEVV